MNKKQITLYLSLEEHKDLEDILKIHPEIHSKVDFIRKAIKILIFLKKGEVFLSSSPDCPNKIPTSIL